MDTPWRTERVLITVRTYPVPANRGIEVSCTAGVTAEGEWIRLHPVPYRLLEPSSQFHKYQWISGEVTKSNDPRPESHRIAWETIEPLGGVLSTAKGWAERKHMIMPLLSPSMCELRRLRPTTGQSLGLVKPRVVQGLEIVPDESPGWSPSQIAKLGQVDMFQNKPAKQLEKIPFRFYYRFLCADAACQGHRMMCEDWEIAESYRAWRRDYGPSWQDAIREKYERELPSETDLHFYVGTLNKFPDTWVIVGLFYPPLSNGQQGLLLPSTPPA